MSYPVPQGYTTHVLTAPPRRSSTAHVVIAWVLAVGTACYLLPWAIAATRNKQNVVPIVLINIFLGWSLVGWVAALVMACLNDDRPAAVIIAQQPYGYAAPPLPPLQPPLPPQLPVGPPATYDWPHSQSTAPYRSEVEEPTRVLPYPYDPRS